MTVMGKAIELAEANNPEVFHWKKGGKCDTSHSALLMIYALCFEDKNHWVTRICQKK